MLKEILIAAGIPVARSIGGWAKNALKDGKITQFEWRLLASTVVRVGLMSSIAFLGLNEMGVDVPMITAAAGSYFADVLFSALKKKK